MSLCWFVLLSLFHGQFVLVFLWCGRWNSKNRRWFTAGGGAKTANEMVPNTVNPSTYWWGRCKLPSLLCFFVLYSIYLHATHTWKILNLSKLFVEIYMIWKIIKKFSLTPSMPIGYRVKHLKQLKLFCSWLANLFNNKTLWLIAIITDL